MPLEPKQEPPYYEITDGPAPAGTKYYNALMSQAGTSDPVMTILQNTVGAVVWTRTSPGEYKATLTGAFPPAKTILQCNIQWGTTGIVYTLVNKSSADELYVLTFSDLATTYTDLNGEGLQIQITVYP